MAGDGSLEDVNRQGTAGAFPQPEAQRKQGGLAEPVQQYRVRRLGRDMACHTVIEGRPGRPTPARPQTPCR